MPPTMRQSHRMLSSTSGGDSIELLTVQMPDVGRYERLPANQFCRLDRTKTLC